jgi:hypothetical protein
MNEALLRETFMEADDVIVKSSRMGGAGDSFTVVMVYCSGMVDHKQINGTIYPQLDAVMNNLGEPKPLAQELESRLEARAITDLADIEGIATSVFSGELLLFFPDAQMLYAVNIANAPQRKPEESSSEISIKGPRDAFTEDAAVNVALVRKRLKSLSLVNEKLVLGRRSQTAVHLLYIKDIANPSFISQARERVRSLDVDGVTSIAQLEEALSDSPGALFPLIDYVGRPDHAADSLLIGRFVVVLEGSPMVLIGPGNLLFQLKSPEDAHLPYYYVALERLLRMAGLLLAIFLPGFYVAVSAFQLDQIPFPLLATITSSRLGLPLSGSIDFFLMLGLFEVFREAGVRLPKAVGQTVAVVGGLIIGDAAIRAGITSPTTLVVTGISTVATFTLVNQTLVGSVTVIRLGVLVLSSIFGIFGLIISSFGLLLYLATLTSFGVPYLSPMSPFSGQGLVRGLLSVPWKRQTSRPSYLKPRDPSRKWRGK